MQKIVLVSTLMVLTACGGGGRVTGDVGKACIAADRQSASPALCSCVQQAANITLGRADQRLAAKFFKEPHLAQETRQSDNRSDEAFWQRYKVFSSTAEQMCR